MRKLWAKYQLHKDKILLILGLLAVTVWMLPYLLLGQGSYIQVHDQVDGEILNYIYGAKYLFKGNIIPEFMNGMSKAAMIPPAPFGVLFYVLFSPYVAFVMMQAFVILAGFLGMYYLCKKLEVAEEISFVVALLFAFMPFYPTYGLAALGQPLLIVCAWELVKGKKKILPIFGIVLYTGFSSLTLIGYVWVLVGLVVGVFLGMKRMPAKRYGIGYCTLVITYILMNLDLFQSMFGEGFTTHRQEMVLHATTDCIQKFKELFFVGGSYSNVYSVAIFFGAIVALCVGWMVVRKDVKNTEREQGQKETLHKNVLSSTVLMLLLVVLTICAVLWNCEAIVDLRKSLGGVFTYFQADRVYWTFPFLWMLLLALVAQLFVSLGRNKALGVRVSMAVVCILLFAVEGYQIFRDSNFNKNIRLLLVDGYEQVTWESLYMEDVFADIDKVIGEEKHSCSVVSLGMYPSIPLYNGYTCADGYSNNYDLTYKHAFREIQAGELEKNDEVRKYLDDWGNRLYLVSATYGANGMLGKHQEIAFENLAYDTSAMQKLNIRYVFATAQIKDAQEMGWTLVEGSPFASKSSFYEVWVYCIDAK